MPKRLFRGLEVTEAEAYALAVDFVEARDCFLPTEKAKFVNRAVILLQLWRRLGLQELANANFVKGWDACEFEMAELEVAK